MTRTKLIYDLASCPMSSGYHIEDIKRLFEEENIILYDSTENPGCRPPYVLAMDSTDKDKFTIIDLGENDIQGIFNNMTKDDS